MSSAPERERERLVVAMGALSTDTIRAKLGSGELTPLGRSVAEDELARRVREGEPPAATTTPSAFDPEPFRDFLRRPLGWSWILWLVLIGCCFLVARSFGTTTKNPGDRDFLQAVILLQALALAGALRTVAALFSSSSARGALVKLAALVALGFVLFGLTVCSEMARSGWQGG